ncbi:hypothetical protein [Nocardia acidivorans]|uniref:hypothetical protein n=1 Tax=Nocardia acidivorans TaxID=404580 RepID=UPI000834EBC9|nr:hypothetical protein [Nocardia acidivorans]
MAERNREPENPEIDWSVVAELLKRELPEGETLKEDPKVIQYGGVPAVEFTSNTDITYRAFRAEPWRLVTHEPWVAVMVRVNMSTPYADRVGETAFLHTTSGEWFRLRDTGDVARLGQRLVGGRIDPAAYAEILGQWHPYSALKHGAVLCPGELRTTFGNRRLPDFDLPTLVSDGEAATLTFYAYAVRGEDLRIDLYRYAVTASATDPAIWNREWLAGPRWRQWWKRSDSWPQLLLESWRNRGMARAHQDYCP